MAIKTGREMILFLGKVLIALNCSVRPVINREAPTNAIPYPFCAKLAKKPRSMIQSRRRIRFCLIFIIKIHH
jgi:hypothetical protein